MLVFYSHLMKNILLILLILLHHPVVDPHYLKPLLLAHVLIIQQLKNKCNDGKKLLSWAANLMPGFLHYLHAEWRCWRSTVLCHTHGSLEDLGCKVMGGNELIISDS